MFFLPSFNEATYLQHELDSERLKMKREHEQTNREQKVAISELQSKVRNSIPSYSILYVADVTIFVPPISYISILGLTQVIKVLLFVQI